MSARTFRFWPIADLTDFYCWASGCDLDALVTSTPDLWTPSMSLAISSSRKFHTRYQFSKLLAGPVSVLCEQLAPVFERFLLAT